MEISETRETKVGVLDRAMAILLAFPQGDTAFTPQELAERTDLPVPTVYRLAQAMTEHGLLMKDGPRFRLGMTLLRLGTLVAEGIDVREQALQHLQWLNAQTEENAELHIRQEEARMVIKVVRSPHNLRPFADLGAPLPLHQGAAGKVLLAWLPQKERDSLVAASVERFGRGNVFAERRLLDELERVRTEGWAASAGERSPEVSALAAPVFDVGGRVMGALALVAPTARLGAEQRERYVPLVCEAARRMSYDMGYVKRVASSSQLP